MTMTEEQYITKSVEELVNLAGRGGEEAVTMTALVAAYTAQKLKIDPVMGLVANLARMACMVAALRQGKDERVVVK